jgi:hypothetical protein
MCQKCSEFSLQCNTADHLHQAGESTAILVLRHYATNRKSRVLYPIRGFFLIYLIFPAALGPGVYSASNRNEHQKH